MELGEDDGVFLALRLGQLAGTVMILTHGLCSE